MAEYKQARIHTHECSLASVVSVQVRPNNTNFLPQIHTCLATCIAYVPLVQNTVCIAYCLFQNYKPTTFNV